MLQKTKHYHGYNKDGTTLNERLLSINDHSTIKLSSKHPIVNDFVLKTVCNNSDKLLGEKNEE